MMLNIQSGHYEAKVAKAIENMIWTGNNGYNASVRTAKNGGYNLGKTTTISNRINENSTAVTITQLEDRQSEDGTGNLEKNFLVVVHILDQQPANQTDDQREPVVEGRDKTKASAFVRPIFRAITALAWTRDKEQLDDDTDFQTQFNDYMQNIASESSKHISANVNTALHNAYGNGQRKAFQAKFEGVQARLVAMPVAGYASLMGDRSKDRTVNISQFAHADSKDEGYDAFRWFRHAINGAQPEGSDITPLENTVAAKTKNGNS